MERPRIIKVHLNKSGEVDKFSKQSTVATSFFITSEKNANGILKQDWIGKTLITHILNDKTLLAIVYLLPWLTDQFQNNYRGPRVKLWNGTRNINNYKTQTRVLQISEQLFQYHVIL